MLSVVLPQTSILASQLGDYSHGSEHFCAVVLCRELKLRIGAQVILTFNIDASARLVNGSRAIVEGFTTATEAGLAPDAVNNVMSFQRSQRAVRLAC